MKKNDFRSIIEQNVNSGYYYPECLVSASIPLGRSGNGKNYYYFDGKKFSFVAFLPSWATPNSRKYAPARKKLEKYNFLPSFTLQRLAGLKKKKNREFIKNLKN